jgi:hypothetical protein
MLTFGNSAGVVSAGRDESAFALTGSAGDQGTRMLRRHAGHVIRCAVSVWSQDSFWPQWMQANFISLIWAGGRPIVSRLKAASEEFTTGNTLALLVAGTSPSGATSL